MCGIAGLYAKSPGIEANLGLLLSEMLSALADRGPDSAGIAVYGDPAPSGWTKLVIRARSEAADWQTVEERLAARFGHADHLRDHDSHAVFCVSGDAVDVLATVRDSEPALQVMSAGAAIELYKAVGSPAEVSERFDLSARTGSHAIGHTRMATESRVTIDGSHPFSTGPDLCLVHNGSLSNHNRLRDDLRREGMRFETDNDSEVAAAYLTLQLERGRSLDEALTSCLTELDGFYTFAVGTREGFAVLRDPIACKPAVLAETDDWVAMGSEYRALAVLPGAASADVWEPAPGRVYHWQRADVA